MNHWIVIRKDCRRRLTEMDYTIDRRARAAAAGANLDWLKTQMPEVMHYLNGKSQEYWRIYSLWFGSEAGEDATEREIDDQIHEAKVYEAGRVGFLMVEMVAGAVLGSIYFNAGEFLSALIGACLALLLARAVDAVIVRWVRNSASHQPLKQLERVTRGLVVLGIVWLLACVAALAILRSQDTSMGALLFSAATAIVALLSPTTSGLCHTAADLLLWSKRLTDDLRSIRTISRELDHLRQVSERAIPPEPGASIPATPRLVKSSGPAAALVIVGLLGIPSLSRAADPLPVYLYADVSPSARAGDVAHVLNDFAGRLSNYDGPALQISVIPFFEDAFTTTAIAKVTVPGNRLSACPTSGTELVHISENYKKAAAKRCDILQAEAHAESVRSRAVEIAKLSAAIDRLSTLNLPGRCTSVNAMIRRAVHESPNGISVLVSDMVDTCAPSLALPASLQPGNQLFLIPVGSRQHSIEQVFDGIAARFAGRPWLQVIEPYRLGSVIDAISHPPARH